MIGKLQKKTKLKNLFFVHKDIRDYKLLASDFITSYYTIQFIHAKERQAIFKKIYDSLNWGGGFILFEKVRAPDARFQDITSQMYDDFKSKNGFNEKRDTAQNKITKRVLDPYTSEENIRYLKELGLKI